MLSGNSSKTFLDIDVVLSPFHTSNATLNGGSNNDTINLSSSTNAGIYLSTVTANSNEGNDIVNINANLSGINSSQVTLEGGKGDDSVSIVSQENSAIYSATVNIDGGNDDDNIINILYEDNNILFTIAPTSDTPKLINIKKLEYDIIKRLVDSGIKICSFKKQQVRFEHLFSRLKD